MKINFLLTAVIIATVSSCSTSYKTGQTPDDVYYSPVRLQNNEVRKEDDKKTTYDNSTVYDSPIYTPSEDREIRRRVNNRRYRRNHDRYNYPYGYNNYPVYGNPKTGTTTKTQQPRTTNLGGFSNSTTSDSANYNPKTGKMNTGTTTTSPVRTFGTPKTSSNNGTGLGNAIRRIFNGDNSSNNNNPNNSYNNGNSNNSTPSRTFESRSSNNTNNSTPSNSNNSSTNSSSSSSSSSSGSSAPVRTFKRD